MAYDLTSKKPSETYKSILKIDSVSSYSAIDFYDNGNNVSLIFRYSQEPSSILASSL